MDRIYLYDSTLRDGAQTTNVDFTCADKKAISTVLDNLGVDYIEGGWPGANPTDDRFFKSLPDFKHAKLTAFGMTRKPSNKASDDVSINALLKTGVKHICLFGKTWDFHAEKALKVSLEDNIEMIADSVSYVVSQGCELLFDAEHFFDGYKANPSYALKVLKTALDNGANWIILCDTNGGTLPYEISEIVTAVTKVIPGNKLGIHCHNDTGNAVANSLAAVQAGARQIQGTLNGLGERCGNADLISIIPTLSLKMGFKTGVSEESLKQLTKISHFVDDRLNRAPNSFAPYVGSAAFAHKGGVHVSAVVKHPDFYEHINPELTGNSRQLLVSNQAGRANILARFKELGIDPDKYSKEQIAGLIETVKLREAEGYAYDSADASFEILARQILTNTDKFFTLKSFRVIDERRWNAKNECITLSEAIVKLTVDEQETLSVAEGKGPVHALDQALRKALLPKYPILSDMVLTDYKVRIINSTDGTEAKTRVLIESKNKKGNSWVTIGVSSNIIDASYNALRDSITYVLLTSE